MQYIIAILALVGVWLLFGHHHQQATQPKLPAAGQSYYEQVFDYTMDNIPPGRHFDWQTYNARGSIAVVSAFVSKSGSTCRSFTESYSILGGAPASDQGYACKRTGRNGWCKLAANNAMTCAMENPSYRVSLPGMAPAVDTSDIDVNAPNPNLNTDSDVDAGVNVSRPASNGRKSNANEAADTITGSAGSAAGYIAKNAGSWFQSLFR